MVGEVKVRKVGREEKMEGRELHNPSSMVSSQLTLSPWVIEGEAKEAEVLWREKGLQAKSAHYGGQREPLPAAASPAFLQHTKGRCQ